MKTINKPTVLLIFLISILQSTYGTTYTVTNTNDSGAGSFRQAIIDANTTPTADIIEFNILGVGPHRLLPATRYPDIIYPLEINGYSQPGAAEATSNSFAIIKIMFDGSNIPYALDMLIEFTGNSTGSILKGVSIVNTEWGTGADQVNNITFSGNYIGIESDGTTCGGNLIAILLRNADNCMVGGPNPADRNILSCNSSSPGLAIQNAIDKNLSNTIQGNYIGTDYTGLVAKGNYVGINNGDSKSTKVLDNIISANINEGFQSEETGANSISIQGNYIGVGSDGITDLGNGGHGVMLYQAESSFIGGLTVDEQNIIAYNGLNGISVRATSTTATTTQGIYIRGNSIHSNDRLGIDLMTASPGLVNSNDNLDTDNGANLGQNYPVIDTAFININGDLVVNGTVNTIPSSNCLIQLYNNPCEFGLDPTGHGEGYEYLSATTVTTDANGDANFSFTITDGANYKDYVTTTATTGGEGGYSTSEFSESIEVLMKADSMCLQSLGEVTYSIAPVSDATGYTWSISGGTIISGQGTTSITVDWSSATTGNFEVCVTADNSCESSCPSCFPVTIYSCLINAVDDINQTLKDVAVDGNVMTNDSDPDGDAITVTSIGSTDITNGSSATVVTTEGGSITMNSDGTYTYTPLTGFTGTDAIAYTITDATGLTSTAWLTIEVRDNDPVINDAPIAQDDQTTTEVNTNVIIPVTANDSDPDNNLDLTSVSIITNPTNGTVTVNTDGTITYTPNTDFVGADIFTYSICDEGMPIECDEARVTVTVNESNTDNQTYAFDDAGSGFINTDQAGNVLNNDIDPEGNTQLVSTINGTSLVSGTATITTTNGGSVTIQEDGSYVFNPATDYVGSDQFTYTVCDNGSPVVCDEATVYLTVFDRTIRISLIAKALLQGALVDEIDASIYLENMRDGIREKDLLPISQPYNTAPYNYEGTETVSEPSTVFADNGLNSIVDWVLVELRSNINPETIIETKAALIQRDGDIVSVDGNSSVTFESATNESYYVSVRHRNHLGIMTAIAISPDNVGDLTIDFTSASLYKKEGVRENPTIIVNGKNVLWGGDVNTNGQILYKTSGNDTELIRTSILSYPGNIFGGDSYSYYIYDNNDVNMNGEIRYKSTRNDLNLIRENIIENSKGNIFGGDGYTLFLSNLP